MIDIPPEVKQRPWQFNYDQPPEWVEEAVASGDLVKVGPGHWVKSGERYRGDDGFMHVAPIPREAVLLAQPGGGINGYRYYAKPNPFNPTTQSLVVTRNGKILKDQRRGIRMFKDAAASPPRYRIVYEPTGGRDGTPKWFLYHGGRLVIDTLSLATGYNNPAGILTWLHYTLNARKALE